jgi:hypothetical protein
LRGLFAALVGLGLGLAAQGCGAPLFATRVAPNVEVAASEPRGLLIRAVEVHPSRDVRRRPLHPGARVAVALELRNQTRHELSFALADVRLVLVDTYGRRQVRWPLAWGDGMPPERLQDGVGPLQMTVPAGASRQVWVAFGDFAELPTRELPVQIALELPNRGAEPRRTLALSSPGRLPVWRADAVAQAGGLGVSWQLFPEGSAGNLLTNDQRFALDPLWVAYGWGFGVRTAELPDDDADSVCCNLAANVTAGVPLYRHPELTLSAIAGAEVATLLSTANVKRRTVGGPMLGVSVSGPPFLPHHGPFPIEHERSLLGSVNIDAGLVWWFGSNLAPAGEPGLMLRVAYLGTP